MIIGGHTILFPGFSADFQFKFSIFLCSNTIRTFLCQMIIGGHIVLLPDDFSFFFGFLQLVP